MNKYKRLAKNILLLLLGNFVTKILSFLMVPFYTSILSTSDYGTADLISTTVLLTLPIFSLLMDEAIMRFALDSSQDKKVVFKTAMVISTVGFLIALCISPVILLFEVLRPYYIFVILYYVSLWLYNLFSNYVKGLDKINITTTAGIIHTFFYLGINIIGLAVLKWGVYGYLLAIDLSNLIAAAYLFFYCKLYKNLNEFKKFDFKLAKEMIKYSAPMIPDYISWWVNNAADRYILALFCGTSVTGIYSVAGKIPTILNSLTSIFSSAWKISAVDNFGSKESIAFYNRVYRVYNGFLVMSAAALIFVTKFLASILYSKDFFIAWKITPILILAYIFSAQAIFLGSIFTSAKKTNSMFLASTAGAIVNLILNFLLVFRFGGMGTAIGTAVGYFVIFMTNVKLTRKIIKIDLKLGKSFVCYSFLILEILAVISDNPKFILFSLICVIVIVLMNIKEFFELLKELLKVLLSKFFRKEKC